MNFPAFPGIVSRFRDISRREIYPVPARATDLVQLTRQQDIIDYWMLGSAR